MLFLQAGKTAMEKALIPVYIFTLITLLISLIFQGFLLAGCTSPSPAIRKFHLLSLTYLPDLDPDSVMGKLMSAKDKVDDIKDKADDMKDDLSGKLDDLLGSDKPKDAKTDNSTTFQELRIGYRGICVRVEEGDEWHCAKHARDMFTADDLGGDPVDLLTVADIFKDKISFAFPFWVALALLSLTWIVTLLSLIKSFIPIPLPEMAAKLGVAAGMGGVLCLCGALVLQTVTVGAVDTLVAKMGMGLVGADRGGAVVGFGWASFGLAVLGAGGYMVLEVKRVLVNKAEELKAQAMQKGRDEVNDMLEKGMNFGRSGRATPESEQGLHAGGVQVEQKGGVRGAWGKVQEAKNSSLGQAAMKGGKALLNSRK